ncbi:hypothetical protein EST38_g10424 [Candolleomyces aberdarensis]|uniref:Uncharacterized protein n=1 Tax=Candolleomyces aberdarensis TaxID=2316362 RepID=A0A4Q2D9M1_9AGAR|nr:hypothetical protein EST38_g10424 [Candolleomyces aberdarensis]
MAGYTGKTGGKVSSEHVAVFLGIFIPIAIVWLGIVLRKSIQSFNYDRLIELIVESSTAPDSDIEASNQTRQELSPPRRGTSGSQDGEGLPSYANYRQTQLVAQNDVLYNTPAAFDVVSAIAASDTTNNQAARDTGGGTPTHGRTSSSATNNTSNSDPDPSTLTPLQRMRRIQRLVGQLNSMLSAAPREGYENDSVEMVKIVRLRTGIAALMEPNSNSDHSDLVQETTGERIPSSGQDGSAAAAASGAENAIGSGPGAQAMAGSGGSGSGGGRRLEPGIGPEVTSSIAFPQPVHYQIPGSSSDPSSSTDNRGPGARQGTLPPPYDAVVATSSDRREEASAAVR